MSNQREYKGFIWIQAMGLVLMVMLVGAPVPAWAQQDRSAALDLQYHRAEMAWKSGASLLEAKARLDLVLAARPDDAEARKLRAQVLLSMERPEAALADARAAVALRPHDSEAHFVLCEAARLSDDLPAAAEALRAALTALEADQAAAAHDATFHVQLSQSALALWRLAPAPDLLTEAEAFARVGLALDPRHAAAYYQMARVFLLRQRPDNAAVVLARGFAASLLTAAEMRQDTLLVTLQAHPNLKAYLHP